MAATIEQPSQETPQKEEANQAPITLKNISKERIGREAWGENQLKEKSYDRIMLGKLHMPLIMNYMKDVVNYWANA